MGDFLRPYSASVRAEKTDDWGDPRLGLKRRSYVAGMMEVLERWLERQTIALGQKGEEMNLLDTSQDNSWTRSKPGVRVSFKE